MDETTRDAAARAVHRLLRPATHHYDWASHSDAHQAAREQAYDIADAVVATLIRRGLGPADTDSSAT